MCGVCAVSRCLAVGLFLEVTFLCTLNNRAFWLVCVLVPHVARLAHMEKNKLSVADTFEATCNKYPAKTSIHHVNSGVTLTYKDVDQGARLPAQSLPLATFNPTILCFSYHVPQCL